MLRMARMHADLPPEAQRDDHIRWKELHHMQGSHDLPRQHRGVHQPRLPRKEEDKPFMTVSLKVDAKTKMGIVTEVKQALRQAYALKINYSATQRM